MRSKKPDIPAAPADLGEDGRRFWNETVEVYLLTSAQLSVLGFAARQVDRAAAARQRLKVEGLTVQDHRGVEKESPVVAVERHATNTFLKLVKAIGLDIEQP
jgi:phage terminase small subunit